MPILRRSCIRSWPVSSPKGRAGALLALSALLLFTVALSLCCGSRSIPVTQLWNALTGGDPSSTAYRILRYSRLPRTVAGLLSGGALAMAGVLLQSILNNAMASPNVIGINAGAGFFAMLAAVLAPGMLAVMPAAAFLGALCTAMLIYLLALRAGLARVTLILAGIAVSSILTAGMNTLILLYPDMIQGASGFLLGGFSGVTMAAIGRTAGYLIAGALLALGLAADLNVLQLGEESAAGLGLAVTRVRFLAILASALLAGAAVSFSGLLGFVGLLVPHMARRLIGGDNRWLLPVSALMGSSFVLLCDVAARVLFAPFEFPVGIIMSLLGGPFFLYLLLHQKRRRVYD